MNNRVHMSSPDNIILKLDDSPSYSPVLFLSRFNLIICLLLIRAMMEDETRPIHEQRFDAAVKVIQSLPANGESGAQPGVTLHESCVTGAELGSVSDQLIPLSSAWVYFTPNPPSAIHGYYFYGLDSYF